MHTEYRIAAMRELRDQQTRFAPRKKCWNRSRRPRNCWRRSSPTGSTPTSISATGSPVFGPEAYRDVKFSGREAKHDLGLFVEDLSDAANVAAEAAGERVVTIDELAKQLNVSTKTISRWRRMGLISRRFVFDGRKRVGFLESSVDRFVAQNSEQGPPRIAVQPTERAEERAMILDRARRLAQAGGGTGRGHQPHCPQDRPQPGDDPLHAQAIRPGPRRGWRFFPTITARCAGNQAQDLPAVPPRRVGGVAGAAFLAAPGPASTASSPRCGPQRIAELPLDYIPNDDFRQGLRCGKSEQQILGADAGER